MAGGYGQEKSRLDRIEEIIERQERANEAAHERFEADDQRLLTAQILMHEAMAKAQLAAEHAERERAITEVKIQETTEKLNALIRLVDGLIRRPGEQML